MLISLLFNSNHTQTRVSRVSKVIFLPFISNPHSNQSVQGLQSFPGKALSLGLEPTTNFYSGPNQPIKPVSADLSNRLIGTATKVSRGVQKTRHFRSEESNSPCQRYYSRLMLIQFSSTQTHTQTRVSRVSRVFRKSHLSLGLEPTTTFPCGPN